MVEIRPIKIHEIQEARRVIFTVAHEIFNETGTLEASIARYSGQGKLNEMDNVQINYFENGGTFLVTIKDERIIGTGAIRFFEKGVCELKRLWLLTEFHGQGHGYRMMQKLLRIAREKGYRIMRLETDRLAQSRAVKFYLRLGFYEIPRYGDDPDDMGMELIL